MTRPRFTATDLDVMRRVALDAQRAMTGEEPPDAKDVGILARFVLDLVDEVDVLVWRATAATMALDGRLSVQDVTPT